MKHSILSTDLWIHGRTSLNEPHRPWLYKPHQSRSSANLQDHCDSS
jgi:hypothetical protein